MDEAHIEDMESALWRPRMWVKRSGSYVILLQDTIVHTNRQGITTNVPVANLEQMMQQYEESVGCDNSDQCDAEAGSTMSSQVRATSLIQHEESHQQDTTAADHGASFDKPLEDSVDRVDRALSRHAIDRSTSPFQVVTAVSSPGLSSPGLSSPGLSPPRHSSPPLSLPPHSALQQSTAASELSSNVSGTPERSEVSGIFSGNSSPLGGATSGAGAVPLLPSIHEQTLHAIAQYLAVHRDRMVEGQLVSPVSTLASTEPYATSTPSRITPTSTSQRHTPFPIDRIPSMTAIHEHIHPALPTPPASATGGQNFTDARVEFDNSPARVTVFRPTDSPAWAKALNGIQHASVQYPSSGVESATISSPAGRTAMRANSALLPSALQRLSSALDTGVSASRVYAEARAVVSPEKSRAVNPWSAESLAMDCEGLSNRVMIDAALSSTKQSQASQHPARAASAREYPVSVSSTRARPMPLGMSALITSQLPHSTPTRGGSAHETTCRPGIMRAPVTAYGYTSPITALSASLYVHR